MIANTSKDFHVIMTGRSLEKVESAKSEIESVGVKGSLSSVQMDVTDEKSIGEAVKYVEKNHGRLDALINNAAALSLISFCKRTRPINSLVYIHDGDPLQRNGHWFLSAHSRTPSPVIRPKVISSALI